jgi:hypothetical protein
VAVPSVKCYHICIVFLILPGQGKKISGFAVGPEQEFYVETDSGIKGGKLNGGFLLWCDSLAQNQAVTNIDAAIREFEDGRELGELLTAKVPGYEPDRAKRFTDLRRVFSIWAFQPGKETTAIDPTAARLVALEIDGKEVKLTIENPASEFKGEAWIDARTRKITRATEAGREVFPKNQIRKRSAHSSNSR